MLLNENIAYSCFGIVERLRGGGNGLNRRENLRLALEGKPHEWIPVSFFYHLRPEQQQGESCTQFHVDFFRETGEDFLKIMHDGLTAPCTLCPSSLEELKEYRPGKWKNPYVAMYLERAQRINEALKGADTYCNVFSPFTLLRRIGDQKLLSYIQEDVQGIRDVLCRMAEDIGWMAEQMVRDAGCMGIFLAFQGAESNFLAQGQYEALAEESDRVVLNASNGVSPWNILHFCGWNQVKNRLEVWREYPGCAVNWDTHVEEMTLAKGRTFFGMRSVFGGFSNQKNGILYRGTKQEVESEAERIVGEYETVWGNTDGLLLGADCSFLPDFQPERFRWVTDWSRRSREGKE